jgi:His-Xaa-Ser system protein HxsD
VNGGRPEAQLQANAEVRFDSRVYALPTIKKAAYRFLKAFTADIRQDGDTWACTLTFPSAVDAEAIERARRELQAEVLDQDLRAVVAHETEPLRNTILALAFSRTGLQGSE